MRPSISQIRAKRDPVWRDGSVPGGDEELPSRNGTGAGNRKTGVSRLGAQAWDAVFAYGCALDMTRRDLQIRERNKQRPWDLGKDVENGAVFAPLTPAADWSPDDAKNIRLSVNGELRQDATLEELIWKIDEIVSHLSGFYHLRPGDLILTGTPAGVGPVVAGDIITGEIDGLEPIKLALTDAE